LAQYSRLVILTDFWHFRGEAENSVNLRGKYKNLPSNRVMVFIGRIDFGHLLLHPQKRIKYPRINNTELLIRYNTKYLKTITTTVNLLCKGKAKAKLAHSSKYRAIYIIHNFNTDYLKIETLSTVL